MAKQLMYTSRRIDGTEAARVGLAARIGAEGAHELRPHAEGAQLRRRLAAQRVAALTGRAAAGSVRWRECWRCCRRSARSIPAG